MTDSVNAPNTPSTSSSSSFPSSAQASQTSGQSGANPGRSSSALERSNGGGAALRTDEGVTSISSSVVAKIAGLATQEIPGVHAMGKTMARTFGSLRSKIPGGGSSSTATQGVSVEVGERQAAVDIDIVAYYGQSIVETANAIRENVIRQIEGMTGLEVVEVNVSVDDLYVGDDDSQTSRVA
jgi:uncharacterized alkaline shock family protein YloU